MCAEPAACAAASIFMLPTCTPHLAPAHPPPACPPPRRRSTSPSGQAPCASSCRSSAPPGTCRSSTTAARVRRSSARPPAASAALRCSGLSLACQSPPLPAHVLGHAWRPAGAAGLTLPPVLCFARAGNQSSGVLLGMQVPPEQEADFQAAGEVAREDAGFVCCKLLPASPGDNTANRLLLLCAALSTPLNYHGLRLITLALWRDPLSQWRACRQTLRSPRSAARRARCSRCSSADSLAILLAALPIKHCDDGACSALLWSPAHHLENFVPRRHELLQPAWRDSTYAPT